MKLLTEKIQKLTPIFGILALLLLLSACEVNNQVMITDFKGNIQVYDKVEEKDIASTRKPILYRIKIDTEPKTNNLMYFSNQTSLGMPSPSLRINLLVFDLNALQFINDFIQKMQLKEHSSAFLTLNDREVEAKFKDMQVDYCKDSGVNWNSIVKITNEATKDNFKEYICLLSIN